ncbi:MAG: TonB-dependent receptor plug domain-containing protein [Deltaproteobacteria bacterium]|nr:TonB-dependent receptor plug domain-containing protein [Deltaproteobacteria bacterium]MBI3294061.1 TonB-dependent receptor plug domain-containing protein [Deltaproteobacteria bacterium]
MRIVLFWSVSLFAFAAFGVTHSGKVLEKGTRLPLKGANVFVLPLQLKVRTDNEGAFSIDIPEGDFTWVVNVSDYIRYEREEHQGPEPVTSTILYLERRLYDVYETTIYGKEEKRDDRSHTLTQKQFLKMPGSGGDPLKAVQNLPGIARASGFSSNIIIEGSAPKDTHYTLDGIEIPIVFHFGGLTSVFFPEAIERLDYLPSGYGPEYGRAMGGQIGVWTKSGRTDAARGLTFVDFFQAGALAEGPVGNGSYLVGVRQSYFGLLLGLLFQGNANFDLQVVPAYTDGIAVYETKFTDHDRFRFATAASDDRLGFLFSSPVNKDATARGSFNYETSFYRFIPEWIHKFSDDTSSRVFLGVGKDFVHVDATSNDQSFSFETSNWAVTPRAEIEHKILASWKSIWGIDSLFNWPTYSFQLPASGSGSSPTPKTVTLETPRIQMAGLYLRNEIAPPETNWTLSPGLRTDYFSSTHETLLGPRFAARYQWSENLTLRGATGLYYQPPQPQEIEKTIGNPSLSASRAVHFTTGFEKDFREGAKEGFSISSDAFYKVMDRIVVPSSTYVVRDGQLVTENYNNAGSGHAVGLASELKLHGRMLSGFLSYTLSQSTRHDPSHGEYLFQYDQTHVATLGLQLEGQDHWTLSARVRYVTGNPYTPVIDSVYDTDAGFYTPIYGLYNSQRLPDFFSVDLRFDKQWIFNSWILSLYVDVQNATNNKNVEAIRYGYNYKTSDFLAGLPILPTIGLKGEF